MSWAGCSDDRLAGLRQWASTRTWDDIHVQIEGYLGRYPSLCPESNNLGSYEQYARGYSKENQPQPQTYRGYTITPRGGMFYIVWKGEEWGFLTVQDAQEGLDRRIEEEAFVPEERTCQERGDCPAVIPPANPLNDCTIAANLCRKDSKCYVGDEAANAPGGCYKPGGVYGTCEERGDCPGACPKGEQFLASGWELLIGCPEGYTRPQFGDYCVCDESSQGKGEDEYGADNSLQGIIKILPQLLMVMVIVSIIGAFKK